MIYKNKGKMNKPLKVLFDITDCSEIFARIKILQ